MVGQGKLDFWRPGKDWENRAWAEVATKMSLSTANLRREDAKNCIYASWMECMVGLIAVIINGGKDLPAGNDLKVFHARGAQLSREECYALMQIVTVIWDTLKTILIPMPAATPNAVQFLLRHAVYVV